MMAGRIDFLHRPRPPLVGWCLLVAGSLAVALTGWFDHRWTVERVARDEQRQERELEAEQTRRASHRMAPPTPDESRIQHILPQLRQPWLPTLRLVEHVTAAPVYLLGMSVDPTTGKVRLDGEAGTFDQVLDYTQDLNQDALLGPAQLRSHEAVTDPAGHATIRFSVTTHWSMP